MLSFVEIPVGTGVSVGCRLCGAAGPAGYLPAPSILEAIASAVSGWSSGPGPNIVLTGPEPYLHKQIADVVTGAIERGVERLSLRTDAAALVDAANASGSIVAGVRHIEVVLIGGSAEAHDRLVGRQGAFDDAIAGMRMFKDVAQQQGIHVLVCGRVPVCGHNVKELPAITLAFAGAGAGSVILDIDEALPSPVVRPWVDAALETGIVNGLWVSVKGRDAAALRVDPLHEIDPKASVALKEVG